jgi:hypothetical protein
MAIDGVTAQFVNTLPILVKHRIYIRKQGNGIVFDVTGDDNKVYRLNKDLEGAVLFTSSQDLTDTEKEVALENLGLTDIIDIIDQLNIGEGLSELNGSP